MPPLISVEVPGGLAGSWQLCKIWPVLSSDFSDSPNVPLAAVYSSEILSVFFQFPVIEVPDIFPKQRTDAGSIPIGTPDGLFYKPCLKGSIPGPHLSVPAA